MRKRGRMPAGMRRKVIKGKGSLWSDFRDWTNNSGKVWMNAGRAAMNAVVPGSGGVAKQITNLLGLGAYHQGGQRSAIFASPVPAMHSTMDEGVRVCHSEYIGDISSSTNFTTMTFALNPGVAETMPWLSTMAAAFQKYRFNGLSFVLKSTSATALNSTNTALGVVAGAVLYNPYDAAPTTKQAMLNIAGVRDGKPAENNIFPVECALQTSTFVNKLVRTGAVSDDLAKYDMGNFILATSGSQAAAVVGELYVTYDVTLMAPIFSNAVLSAHVTLGGPTDILPLGVSNSEDVDRIGVSLSGTAITFPVGLVGKYMVDIQWYGTNTVSLVVPSLTFTNCTQMTGGAFTSSFIPAAGTTAASAAYVFAVSLTSINAAAIITVGTGGTLPHGTTSGTIAITRLNSDQT
jgi:hypothetical protein